MSLDRLNDKQREAAMCLEGPLLILAGAGSGKTSTMTERIAYMIEQGVAPWNILAVTFTNKAAGEMRTRVEALVGNCSDMWIMTFHSMCLRILRYHYDRIGYDSNFVIYDGTDQKTLVKNILKELNINDREFSPQYLLSIISSSKERGLDAEGFRRVEDDNFKNKTIYNVFRAYETQLKNNNAMDFDDLLLNTLKLFRADEEILLKYQNRFRYIMVDEYQDTNHIQYKIIKMLADSHHNLCVVGDDDQCIYQWRGADIRNILDFEKDFPEAKVIKLEQNYRSTGNILAAAHSVISNNRGRKAKKLWTEQEDGEKIKYFRAETEKDEAYQVAWQIDLMKNSELKYSDFAILYRTNAQSRHFEAALTQRDIPYRVLSGLRYYDRKEIKDVMAYMRLVVNPRDDLSLKRVINEPKRGMGPKSVEKIEAFARLQGKSIFQGLCDEMILSSLPNKAYSGVKAMVDCIVKCQNERENLMVSDIYDMLLVETGYMKALEDENTVEAEGRIENLMEFKSVIYDYERECEIQGTLPSIDEFMEKLTLMAEVDNHDETQDAVVLMTMHSAKGLEFPVVFMPGLEDGLFPGSRSFDSESGMEEERRLCYVGMTRAKEKLILSSAAMRTLYGRTDYTRESQFLRELDKKLVEGDSIYERRSSRDTDLGVFTGSFDGYAMAESPKPYDALKYARSATKAKAADGAIVDYTPGDRVKHVKFGEGTVIDQDKSTVSVIFESVGMKKLAKGFAGWKKM